MSSISVIVPIYNSIEFLKQCIDSITNQTYKDLEIILVDDGSNDGSELLCDEYAAKDKRIKVLHKKNGGLVKARKDGFNASTSKLIGFVDSDDWLEPDMYEKLFRCFNLYNSDIVMCGRFEDSSTSNPVFHGIEEGLYEGRDLISKVFPRMIVNERFFEWGLFPSYWDKLFKREVIEKYILSVDEKIVMGEDAAGVYPCILNARSIYVLRECLYHYRQSENSMVKKTEEPEKERNRFKALYKTTQRVFDNGKDIYDLSEQWKKYLLFLMTPRADVLYEDLDKLEYLFPFPKVKKGDRIVIYGAGLWGKRLLNYLEKTSFCEVVAISDRNYENLRKKGLRVISPDDIKNFQFDSIVLPISYAKTREVIYKELSSKLPDATIYEPDQEEIFSNKTIKRFGLI